MSLSDVKWRMKTLCELPNRRMGPQIARRLRRTTGPSQLDSWCNPMGHPDKAIRERYKGLVGQIFFKTNDKKLDAQDREAVDAALDYWRSYCANFYRRAIVVFKFVGNADHRGNASYNAQLALERANVVKGVFDTAFSGYTKYESGVETLGESKASQTDLAGSRRVDIFSTFLIPMDQSILFENQVLKGNYRGERSCKFKVRVLGGGGAALGPLGFTIMTVEILDPRTDRTAMYRLTSLNAGMSFGLSRPTLEFTDVTATSCITIDDFEGNGGVASVSAGFDGTQVLVFHGPMERGVTNQPVKISTSGWDTSVGLTADFLGYWHRLDN